MVEKPHPGAEIGTFLPYTGLCLSAYGRPSNSYNKSMIYQLLLRFVCLMLDMLAAAGAAAQEKIWKLPCYASRCVFWNVR